MINPQWLEVVHMSRTVSKDVRGIEVRLYFVVYGLFLAITAYKSVKKDVNKAQKEQDEFVQQRQARRAKRKAKRKAKKQSDLEAKGENAVVNDADVNSDTDNDDDDEDKTLKAAEKERVKSHLNTYIFHMAV